MVLDVKAICLPLPVLEEDLSLGAWERTRSLTLRNASINFLLLRTSSTFTCANMYFIFPFTSQTMPLFFLKPTTLSLWFSNEECTNIVEDKWSEWIGGSIQEKIETCALGLTNWAKKNFGELKKKIKRTEHHLLKAQNSTPDAHNIQTCKSLSEKLDKLHRLEESYWFMRAHANTF